MNNDSLREQILSSEQIFKGRIVDLRILDIKLADGTVTRREMVYHPGAVAVVPIDQDGRVVLVHQYRHGASGVLLELPAGGLYPGEDPIEAAKRELQEEIGYVPRQLTHLGSYHVAAAYTTEAITIYLGRDLIPSRLKADYDERLIVERIAFNEALRMAETNEIRDAKTIIGLMWAVRYLES
ncbi:MAG: NUDIX hydrolase [Chloroflexi bacterium]|nr:NUDIX hydrolase [Chloroflexota bacterium]